MEEKKEKRPIAKTWWVWLIIAVAIFAILLPSDDEKPAETPDPETEALKVCYNLQAKSERLVESILKAPKSAEFPDFTEWEFRGEVGSDIYVLAYVDAQNELGVPLREDFIIKFEMKDGEYEAVVFGFGDEVIFDNTESSD